MLRHEMGELRTTLPGHDYRSPEVFELDRERVFFREWMYVARADEAPEPGDFVTVDVAGESVVVVRGQDERAARASTTSAGIAARASATRRPAGTRRARSSARTTRGRTPTTDS